jgi:hypothetical protein
VSLSWPGLAVALILLGVLLWMLASGRRRGSGLPGGAIIYADRQTWERQEKPLFARRLGLTGRPMAFCSIEIGPSPLITARPWKRTSCTYLRKCRKRRCSSHPTEITNCGSVAPHADNGLLVISLWPERAAQDPL